MSRRITFRYQLNPEQATDILVDIAPFEEPGELYRCGWDIITGNDAVSSDVEFRGFSSENQLVLQDNVVPGHIVHENLDSPIAGQIGLINHYGMLLLLVMQWRRDGGDWAWYRADAVDWRTFQDTVDEVFAHAVHFAQFNVPEFDVQQNFFPDQVPQDVRLLVQTFGNHVLDELTVTEAEMQAFDGPLQLYDFMCGAVFGIAANEFHPVNFRGILGDVNANGPVNVDLPVVPNQTVGGQLRGQLGLLGVDGAVVGQLRINAQRKLVLLVIKWHAAGGTTWLYFAPQMNQWEAFRGSVREMFAYSVLVAQF